MKYGVAIFPEKKVQDIANSYRKRYDPHYGLIPPHITLKEAFTLEEETGNQEETITNIVQHLEKVAERTAPFTIFLNKIGTFHPNSNTIYVSMYDGADIIQLHDLINEGPLSHPETYAFIPHITIGQKLSEDELLDVYGSLRMTNISIETKIDRFHLLYQLENQSWCLYQSFILNGHKE
ncbi:2'-5' RNA ligase family protein [Mechercharimyces sp. CAU 1602]|uniref:2'-5' RNA ligase family protein n=1 Tax=Mechercharimyces sp. CAU 1602 TaxID=2973933 RepID=UPI002162C023|nr:2'-5' RNA ligase family protein [Mechercharimyces sp. CAU 1602]MCS1350564.1 2'-5' RNA ligase family protein [Mechercharimyces sp. CAU 1602]